MSSGEKKKVDYKKDQKERYIKRKRIGKAEKIEFSFPKGVDKKREIVYYITCRCDTTVAMQSRETTDLGA